MQVTRKPRAGDASEIQSYVEALSVHRPPDSIDQPGHFALTVEMLFIGKFVEVPLVMKGRDQHVPVVVRKTIENRHASAMSRDNQIFAITLLRSCLTDETIDVGPRQQFLRRKACFFGRVIITRDVSKTPRGP